MYSPLQNRHSLWTLSLQSVISIWGCKDKASILRRVFFLLQIRSDCWILSSYKPVLTLGHVIKIETDPTSDPDTLRDHPDLQGQKLCI